MNINDFHNVIHNEAGSGRNTGSRKNLSHVGGDPDIIDVWIDDRSSQIGPGRVSIWLGSANGVTWYKEIKAITINGGLISLISTQDSQHGPSEMIVQIDQFPDSSLIFDKAKLAGAHTDMYQLGGLDQFGGMQLSFEWVKD